MSSVTGTESRPRLDATTLFAVVVLGLGLAALFAMRPWRRSAVAWNSDLNHALAEATPSGKPVFVEISAEWCGPCKEMERDTFSNREVGLALSRLHPVRLNYDSPEGQAKVQAWGAIGLPAHVLVRPNGQVQALMLGNLSPDQLLSWLRRHGG